MQPNDFQNPMPADPIAQQSEPQLIVPDRTPQSQFDEQNANYATGATTANAANTAQPAMQPAPEPQPSTPTPSQQLQQDAAELSQRNLDHELEDIVDMATEPGKPQVIHQELLTDVDKLTDAIKAGEEVVEIVEKTDTPDGPVAAPAPAQPMQALSADISQFITPPQPGMAAPAAPVAPVTPEVPQPPVDPMGTMEIKHDAPAPATAPQPEATTPEPGMNPMAAAPMPAPGQAAPPAMSQPQDMAPPAMPQPAGEQPQGPAPTDENQPFEKFELSDAQQKQALTSYKSMPSRRRGFHGQDQQ